MKNAEELINYYGNASTLLLKSYKLIHSIQQFSFIIKRDYSQSFVVLNLSYNRQTYITHNLGVLLLTKDRRLDAPPPLTPP